MSQPAAERTTFPPNARPIIYKIINTVQTFNEACAKCNTLVCDTSQTFWSMLCHKQFLFMSYLTSTGYGGKQNNINWREMFCEVTSLSVESVFFTNPL